MANWTNFKTTLSSFITTNFTSFTLKRNTYATYDYANGQAISQASSTIRGSIQDVREKDLVSLPEGLRDFTTKKFYTVSEVKAKDVIVDGSISYEVMKPVETWKTTDVMFYKVFLKKVDNQQVV
jgi:hypothetical protein